LHIKLLEPEDEPPTPAVIKAVAAIEAAINVYEQEKGKGTIEEITRFRELLVLVDDNTTRLFRLQEEKLLHLFDLLLAQVFRGSQFEHRVVDMFAKFIERGRQQIIQSVIDLLMFFCFPSRITHQTIEENKTHSTAIWSPLR